MTDWQRQRRRTIHQAFAVVLFLFIGLAFFAPEIGALTTQ